MSESRPVIDYDLLESQLPEELGGEWDLVANLANFSSFIWHAFKESRGSGASALDVEIRSPIFAHGSNPIPSSPLPQSPHQML